MKLNWSIAKIEEIAEINPRLGKADIPDDLTVSFVPMPAVGAGDGSIDVSNVRPFGEVKKGFTAFQKGDVLFAKITPCMENGKMAVVPKVENGYAFGSTEFHVLRPKPGIDAHYLYYYVSSNRFRGDAEHQMTGAVGQKRVPTQYLRECTIPLAPLNEQTRIVAEIEKQFSRLDEAVANLKRVKTNLKRYKAAVLKAAVEGKLTEEWRRRGGLRPPDPEGGRMQCAPTQSMETGAELLERILAERRKAAGKGKYKAPVTPETANLPELPGGWVWATPDVLAKDEDSAICAGPFGTIFKAKDFRDEGVPIIFLRHVSAGKYLTHKPGFMDRDKWEELFKPYSVYGGELLVTKLGEPPGVCAIYPEGIGPAMVTPDVMKMSVDGFCAHPMYLMHFFNSESARNNASDLAFGTTRLRLTLPIFRELAVPLPPLAEQHQIVAEVERRLSIVAGAEAQVDANLRRADRLRQSILKQAFSGQLVPQDPNDEPASVLLERIRNGALVGANKYSPRIAPRQSKRANIDSPLQKQQNPRQPAEPEPAATGFTCLDDLTAALLSAMQPGREYARADLADPLGLTTGQWNAAIQELKRVGKVRQTGEKRGARYQRME